ncbi:MAG: glycosyltransferase [Selenomonadaceae bacterium]|nr:glycosyltransferase [Selenomonadaceae bacterium]
MVETREKETNFVSAVIYIHNSAAALREFLTAVREVLGENFAHGEIICVDDASQDESREVIRAVAKKGDGIGVSLLSMSHYHGVEAAMNAGVDLSIGDFVFEFDSALLDFPPELIMTVYRRSLDGYDIVNAAPQGKNRLSSGLFYWLFDKFSHVSYHLTTERFRILSRRVINRVASMNKAIPYRKAVYAGCGFPMDNIFYEARPGHTAAEDTEENSYRQRLAVDAMLLFTDVGAKISAYMTGLMMMVAVLTAVYALITYVERSPVAGWTSTTLFLSFAFFCLFGLLTLIAKYLQLIVRLVFQRQHYSFIGIEKLTK